MPPVTQIISDGGAEAARSSPVRADVEYFSVDLCPSFRTARCTDSLNFSMLDTGETRATAVDQDPGVDAVVDRFLLSCSAQTGRNSLYELKFEDGFELRSAQVEGTGVCTLREFRGDYTQHQALNDRILGTFNSLRERLAEAAPGQEFGIELVRAVVIEQPGDQPICRVLFSVRDEQGRHVVVSGNRSCAYAANCPAFVDVTQTTYVDTNGETQERPSFDVAYSVAAFCEEAGRLRLGFSTASQRGELPRLVVAALDAIAARTKTARQNLPNCTVTLLTLKNAPHSEGEYKFCARAEMSVELAGGAHSAAQRLEVTLVLTENSSQVFFLNSK